MSDIFDKIASDFISETKSAPSNNEDIFDKIASEFISKRASSLTQPLRSNYDYGERHANSFLDMDEDGDGRISPEEWEEGFDGLDSDNSGFLQDNEWDNPNFDLLDEDGDGVISRDEWSEGFDEIDIDDDGFISENEYYKKSSDLTEIDEIVDDLQEDLSEVDEIVDDLVDEEEFSGRFVEDFDSEMDMHKSARFSKGEKGREEFEKWKEDNPEAGEEFDKQTEINKDVVKNRAKAMSSDDFQELDEEQQETEDKIKELEERVDDLQDEKDDVVDSVSKKARYNLIDDIGLNRTASSSILKKVEREIERLTDTPFDVELDSDYEVSSIVLQWDRSLVYDKDDEDQIGSYEYIDYQDLLFVINKIYKLVERLHDGFVEEGVGDISEGIYRIRMHDKGNY
tara:strand:- start:224 stop:1417 length:1194 start_codon:yes stop_codon:yes gene_type:complete